MDCFRVFGGDPLQGTVQASGSKNASLPLMVASLLVDGTAEFRGLPRLRDIDTLTELLQELGVEVEESGDALRLSARDHSVTAAPYDIVRRMRASICVLGPLLARRGAAQVPLPGGCVFGLRPVDLHVRGLQALGAEIRQEHGCLIGTVPRQGLRGASMDLRSAFGSTVLGTINVMMAATLARGGTVINSAAREPEVAEVANFLNACGARIEGVGSDRLEIEGVERLQAPSWTVPADRIETGTLLLAGAMTGGKVRVERCRPKELEVLSRHLSSTGVAVTEGEDWLQVDAQGRELQAEDIDTAPFPGFPTDLQAQWMAFATRCRGRTRVRDRVYPERFMHAAELQRLGARLDRDGDTSWVHGPCALTGAPVLASDLRASAALVLAGLVAEGETVVRRVYHLDRGYQSLEQKLVHLGAAVRRERDSGRP